MFKNNNGISLISLIVTIIAIIIIASISYFNGLEAPETASFSKFMDEIVSIRTELATVRAKNLMEHDDMNYGFKKVILVDMPYGFVSFSGDACDVGYLIDFELLDYKPMNRGMEEITGNEVIFGEDDAYVYDSNGAVYYVKGYENEDKLYFNAKCFE